MLGIANARNLFNAAVECAERGRFGVATSLAVLSAEECTKSYALLARAISGSGEEVHLRTYFTSHKAKHEMGATVLTLFRIIDRLYTITLEVALDKSVSDEERAGNLISRVSEWSDAEVSGRENVAGDIAAWKKDADRAKQKGFYVDRLDDRWHSPAHVSETEYIFRRDYALQFIDILEAIVEYGSLAELRQAFEHLGGEKRN
jgi:AbiV family abortive infection protein